MKKNCGYCGDLSEEYIFLPILSYLCPTCFVRFFEMWARKQIDMLDFYVQFKRFVGDVKHLD